ncbi:alpha/beta fold hydrolase [Mucilaginibacter sp.]|jgi:pimeloyl-ACP methyl ester carboxylesterase|uniref:alpha/beta fold hydrolase n=1 Tax=Mucilaginibacter sp. TaxID=1882438 RepID=UPI003563D9B5
MKKLKQIVNEVKDRIAEQTPPAQLTDLLWQLICYPPKMPLRLQQEQFLNQAETFSVTVHDEYFTKKDLQINGFKWGNGKRRVLITHGWGSKAADFTELIAALQENPNLEIITFDAPANGSSDGELSNFLLFVEAAKAIIQKTGAPHVVIGHSFGAMANVVALNDLHITPSLLVSLTPFILLKENFIKSMTTVGVPADAQEAFLQDFERKYSIPASYFNMPDLYKFDDKLNHWLAYDEHDMMLPYSYLKEFLEAHPTIRSRNYDNVGHERIIKSAQVINNVVEEVNKAIAN